MVAEPSSDTKGCVALGVTGSIAAYKAADLTSKLVQTAVDVRVLMTPGAAEFVHPGTFAALSRRPVVAGPWDERGPLSNLEALAQAADLYVVAPATANTLAKLALGIADNAVTAFALHHDGPLMVAPAMNPRMWGNAATEENCRRLRERGVRFLGPEPGRCACGEVGAGRLAAVPALLDAIHVQLAALRAGAAGRRLKLLVSAGPTREALDPVRFLSNRSSGKMGYAIAGVAAAAGHEVTLVSGPTALPTPLLCRRIDVVSAAEMADAIKDELPRCDVLVMAAAVADYRPAAASAQKIKKGQGGLAVELERTEDILASVAAMKRSGQKVMGFAAETQNLAQAARRKLERKRLDWIVANDVGRADVAFGSDENEVTVFWPGGEERLPRMLKTEVAARLVAIISQACGAG